MAGKNQLATTKQSPGLDKAMERAKVFWTGLRPQQQAFFGLGLAITVAAVIFFVKMIATPDYKPLMNGLEPADAQAISSQLAAKKIPCIVSPDGTSISVPADQVDAARLEVASHETPHSGRIGFEIFDKVSWGQTEFDEKVNYQRALEGELERTIQTIGSVKSARVHLVMASDSVFLDRARGAKASVALRLKRGSLSREDSAAIARLVAGAVDELKPSDVVIIDADSNQSLARGNGTEPGSEGLEQELTRRLIATLSPVVGADRLRASVNVEYENGSSEESQERYDPAVSAVLTMQHSEEMSGPGAGASGVPGTASNLPGAKPAAAAAPKDPSQSSKTDNNTYGVNRTTRHSIEPAGGIRRLTAAVVLDDAVERKQVNGKWVETRHKRTPDEIKLIGDLAQASIGFNSTRGDVVSIQNLSFDRPEATDAAPVNFVEQARKQINDYSFLIRYAVLLGLFVLVYLLTIRPIQKRILSIPNSLLMQSRAPVQAAQEEELAAVEPAGGMAKRSLALKKQLTEFVQAQPVICTIAVRAWLREEPQ